MGLGNGPLIVNEPVDKVYGGCECYGTTGEHPVDFGQISVVWGLHGHAHASVRMRHFLVLTGEEQFPDGISMIEDMR